ncbi:hypothetical protein [Streptomyces albofaciens]|uniref:hypothetical protein n=1 Tax=Streptomyces albofaciens TaxID=66866 RepID=UPI00142F077F|nr:hypothetical protein [Streptomyces albofaciens]
MSSLKGWARGDYPVAADDVQLTVDAHRAEPADGSRRPATSWGTFRLYHKVARPGRPPLVLWADFKVDCLTTGGPTATVTGTLERTSPHHAWQHEMAPHSRMGASFYVAPKGAGPSRVGLIGPTAKGRPKVTPCAAPAADTKVIAGGYTLKDRVRQKGN